MPRDIPVGNGQMLVAFDGQYRIRDLYYPHVGQENHAGHRPCHFGVWVDHTPGKGSKKGHDKADSSARLAWMHDGWSIDLRYETDTMATRATLENQTIGVKLECCDAVDFHRPLLIRRINVTNQADTAREIRLFHHNEFHMYGNDIGDTAYFDPQTTSLIHYRNRRYLMATWHADGERRVDQYATGRSGFGGAEGTYRDADDGELGNNPISQGAVDSTMMLSVHLEAGASKIVYMLIGAGDEYADIEELQRFVERVGPEGSIERTAAYWKLWLNANRALPIAEGEGRPPKRIEELFKRSLLLVRSQIDNSGAIIAANDSDYMQYSRDTYSYLWPRDGAMVAYSLDLAGFPDVARNFYSLCSRLITDHGFFQHKYNPDGSPASSWHPWVNDGRPQLPIQEDETALVIWGVWEHYTRYRDIEFVRPLWVNLVTKAADFLERFRDPVSRLPLPSYDLWEERWGIHAFTVASVYAGLEAAHQFALAFGDKERAETYRTAAREVQDAFQEHFWDDERGHYLRRLEPIDLEPLTQFMHSIEDRRGGSHRRHVANPQAAKGNGERHPDADKVQFKKDTTLDASMYAIFGLGMLSVDDPRVRKTMNAIESRLRVKTDVGGIARYEDDGYHRVSDDVENIPGNPWFICTLWIAQYRIERARTIEELEEALPIFEWVADHMLPSGVLAEQVHPRTNEPLSVSPLTWSHATVVSTFMLYLRKRNEMQACPTCGRPHMSSKAANLERPHVKLSEVTLTED